MDDRVHIIISDKNGRTLFDSDRYIQNLYACVYDFEGNLLYSSSETSTSGKRQSETASQLTKQKAKRKERKKDSKFKTDLVISDTDRKSSVLPSGQECNITALEIKRAPCVVIRRLKDVKSPVKETVCYNRDLSEVTVQKCDTPDIHSDETLVSGGKMSRFSEVQLSVDGLGDRTEAETQSTSIKNETGLTDSSVSMACDICGVMYRTGVMLKRHKQVHEIEQTDTENPLQCSICKKVYPNWRSLTIHKRKHGAARDNICEKCGKGFRTKQELVRHEFVHSSAKSSPCHICGKLFKNKAYAQMHSKLHSAENRKHICKFCGKHFLRGPDIQKHMRIHTGEKPFICSQCGRSFSESSHLIRHERLHTGEKPYKCDKCELSFTHKEVLIRHSFTHMEHLPFSCKVCNKEFITKRELDHHWLVHDKPTDPAQKEICAVCGKVFSHVLYLRYHMRTHRNPEKLEYQACGKEFKKISCLKQHVSNQHQPSLLTLEPDLESQTGAANSELPSLTVQEVIDPISVAVVEQHPHSSGDFGQILLQYESSHTKLSMDKRESILNW